MFAAPVEFRMRRRSPRTCSSPISVSMSDTSRSPMPSRPGAIISGTAVAGSKGSRIAAANSRSLLRYRDVTTPGATPAAAATDFTVVCVYPRAANAVPRGLQHGTRRLLRVLRHAHHASRLGRRMP